MFSFLLCSCEDSFDESTNNDETSYEQLSKRETLKIGYTPFYGIFNPFYASNANDMDVVGLTFANLITVDRNGNAINKGKQGEMTLYNGNNYKYEGISDYILTMAENGEVTYKFSLRDNIKFSDGEILNADDVIFTFYVLSDPSYNGPNIFSSLPILGMEEYKNGNAENICGIIKNDEFSFEIKMSHYDTTAISKLSVYIAPLHYYGSVDDFNYDNNMFGFTKGNINSNNITNNIPLGAGAYIFKGYKDGVVYFERNIHYYKGEPIMQKLELHEFSENDLLSAVINGKCDICEPLINKDTLDEIKTANGQSVNGVVLNSFTSVQNGYGYIGLNAKSINVGNDPFSEESKYLRKAFSTLFSAFREDAVRDYYGDHAFVIEYPASVLSWIYPDVNDDNYKTAFSADFNGENIYPNGEINKEAALNASIEFFKLAGFIFDNVSGKFISSPDGASLTYNVLIPGNGKTDHPAFEIFENAKEALNEIGITLVIKDVSDTVFWECLDNGEACIWAAGWDDYSESNFRSLYHSESKNIFGITDSHLDELIETAAASSDKSFKREVYNDCFELIFDYAVEIPIYQRMDILVINSYNVNIKSFEGDYTENFSWINEMHKIDLN